MIASGSRPRPHIRIDDQKSFQKLKRVLERRIVDAVDLSKAGELPDGELREEVEALATHVCASESVGLPPEMRELMVREILDEIYGFGPLESLMQDPGISEILVNGPDHVSIERDGRLKETAIRFADESHLLELIQRLARRAGSRINERAPVVEARLPDGSLLNAIIHPLAARGPMLSIRRSGSQSLRLDDLLRLKALAPEMADFLSAAVRGRVSFLISGASGAGKTTLLGSLGRLVPERERIVTIEETAELDLGRADVVSLETRTSNRPGHIQATLRELLRSGLRMRPDRLLIGEVRGGEILEVLQAMNAGHSGSMVAVNAVGTQDALARIELLASGARVDAATNGLRQQIASAFQVLVHVARLPSGDRKVVRISELCGCFDGSYVIEDIFVYRALGADEEGREDGLFYSTGYEPLCLPQLASLGHALDSELFAPRELSQAGSTRVTIPN
jgi:pilus assembly protein CpaF